MITRGTTRPCWLYTSKSFVQGPVAKGMLSFGVVWASLFLGARLAGAETPGSPPMAEVSDFGSAAIRMIGSLILILGVIVCIFYLIKRVRLGALTMGKTARMRLVSTLSLAPKRSVALVEVGGRWLVLGVGAENVSLLSEFDEPPRGVLDEGAALPEGAGFQRVLQDKIFGRKAHTVPGRGEK